MTHFLLRDRSLSTADEQQASKAQAFVQTYLADVTGTLDQATCRERLRQACAAGLAGTEVPTELGGAGASYAGLVQVCEAFARQHAGFGFSLVNHHNIAARIAEFGTDALRARWLDSMLDGTHIGCTAMTEPQSGSDFTCMQTRAVRAGDGWLLNGAKAWVTNTAHADLFLVYAQTDQSAGARGIGGFLVDARTDGFERERPYEGFGIEGTGVGGFRLHDVYVDADSAIFAPGEGFKSAMRGVNRARTYVAAIDAAMMDKALQTASRYAESRQAFGQPLMRFQGIGWSLATVATHLQALYLLVDASTRAIVGGQDAQGIAAMAKKYANDHAGPALAACMQAMGAEGLRPVHRIDRFSAWAKAFCYADGSVEMMNERIVHLLRKPLR